MTASHRVIVSVLVTALILALYVFVATEDVSAVPDCAAVAGTCDAVGCPQSGETPCAWFVCIATDPDGENPHIGMHVCGVKADEDS